MPEKIPTVEEDPSESADLLEPSLPSEADEDRAVELKWRAIDEYLKGIEKREETIFRLGPERQFFTDPKGLDPLDLFPPSLKKEVLGKFLHQGLAEYDDFTENDVYIGPSPSYDFPKTEQELTALRALWSLEEEENLPVDYLMYQKGDVEIMRDTDPRLICILNSITPRQYHDDYPDPSHDTVPIARLAIWEDEDKGRRYLGLHIDSSFNYFSRSIEALEEGSGKEAFLINPFHFLAMAQAHGNPKYVEEQEEKFLTFWVNEFTALRINKERAYFPEQQGEGTPGVAVGILERAIAIAPRHGYEGITATPAYFHTAENFERQGFRFERQEDADRMAMLKMVFQKMDEDRYRSAMESAWQENVRGDAAQELAGNALLMPQERSWIALLNIVRNRELIPPQYDLGRITGEIINAEQKRIEQHLWELREAASSFSGEFEKSFDRFALSRRGALQIQQGQTLEEVRARLRFDERGYSHGKSEDAALYEKPLPDAGELLKEFEEFLNLENERFGRWSKILEQDGGRLGFPPVPGEGQVLLMPWNSLRMQFRFEGTLPAPEYIQPEMDRLIQNEILTGNTQNPPGSYLEKILAGRSGPPYTIVYHMYDRDGRVEQPGGTTQLRPNLEHFRQIQVTIEQKFQLPARVEKSVGNVRNPGPNRPLGWHAEEPAVWTDELLGIERSTQNALVISCSTLEEVEQVADYLHTAGYKEKENESRTDPAWFVPDIRIFGVPLSYSESQRYRSLTGGDFPAHYKPALLHVRKGEKDGYASTLTHETHRMVSGFTHVPVLIHEAMDRFISKDEKKRGEYEFWSR